MTSAAKPLSKTDLIKRELDIEDSIAYLLHGATIKGAYRRRYGAQELIIAGLTDKGAPFILELSAVDDSLIGLPQCDGKEIERIVLGLKDDIDRAESGERIKL